MAELDELLEDYSRHAVPVEKTVSGLRIGTVITGITITVPAFLTGIEIGQGLGLLNTVIATITGGFLLFLIGACSGTIAARTHLSTYIILQYAFGISGARFVSFFISLTTLGWFAVTMLLFADSLYAAIKNSIGLEVPHTILLVTGSLLMIVTTIFGFKALDRLSTVIVPLLAVFLLFVAITSTGHAGLGSILAFSGEGMSMGHAISAVTGGYIVGMTLLPDLCRYAKTGHDGGTGAFIGGLLGYPMVLLLSALPSIATGSRDYIGLLTLLGLGYGGIFMLILATWTTNANNLYSGSLAISSILTTVKKWQITLLIGMMGSILHTINRFVVGNVLEKLSGIQFFASFNLGRHPAHAHQAEHSEIPQQGPERMFKRRRAVPLYEKVAYPGKAVSAYRQKKQKIQIMKYTEQDDGKQGQCPDEMKKPRCRPAVFADVVRPEF